jgi:hypothetical protein
VLAAAASLAAQHRKRWWAWSAIGGNARIPKKLFDQMGVPRLAA